MRKLAFAAFLLLSITATASERRSYFFRHGDTNIISGGAIDVTSAVARTRSYDGDVFWARIDGREFVIRDEATLARIDRLFEPMHATDPDMERLHAKMRPIEARERKLDREADELSDRDEDDAPLTVAERDHLRDLHRQLKDIESQLRDLEREEDALDHKRDALEADAERQMWRVVDEAIRNGVARAR